MRLNMLAKFVPSEERYSFRWYARAEATRSDWFLRASVDAIDKLLAGIAAEHGASMPEVSS